MLYIEQQVGGETMMVDWFQIGGLGGAYITGDVDKPALR